MLPFGLMAQHVRHLEEIKTDAHYYRLDNTKQTGENYDVHFYFLDLEMTNQDIDISGTARIDLSLNEPSAQYLKFDFDSEMVVDEVHVDGGLHAFTHESDTLSIPIAWGKSEELRDDIISVVIDYHGTPPYGMRNETSEDYGVKTTFSLSEPYDAMGWFPVKQDLTDKADSSWVYITVPESLKAGSNGILTQVSDMGNNTDRYEWKSSYPIDYYLLSVAVGPYQEYSFYTHPEELEDDSILVQNYVYDLAGYLSEHGEAIDKTSDYINYYSSIYGIYPHYQEKYGHCLVELGGAMEHQTMTTMGDFSFTLIVHELAHSWFGNYLTCGTWQDIWINEGFAVYSEYLSAQEHLTEADADQWLEDNQNFAMWYPNGSVYVPFEDVGSAARIFDYILTYKKGGQLMHMIRYLINDDDVFFEVLRTHLNTYANATATGEDFKDILETETGIDFDPFFEQWYYGEGFPSYYAQWYQSNDTVYVHTEQGTSCDATTLFTIPVEYEMEFETDPPRSVRLNQSSNDSYFEIYEPRPLTGLSIDPDNWILGPKSIELVSAFQAKAPEFELYPNPAKENLHITMEVPGSYTISLFNIEGQKLEERTETGRDILMNLDSYPCGSYIIRLQSDNGLATHKNFVHL